MKNKFISRRDFETYSREQGSDRQGDTFWEEFSTLSTQSIRLAIAYTGLLHFSLNNATSKEF